MLETKYFPSPLWLPTSLMSRSFPVTKLHSFIFLIKDCHLRGKVVPGFWLKCFMREIFCLKKIFGCITNNAKSFPPLWRRGKPPPTLFSWGVADFQDVFNSTVLDLVSWGEVLALLKLTLMLLPAPVKPSGGRTHGSREGFISSWVLWSEAWGG